MIISSPNHISPPSMIVTFFATYLIAVLLSQIRYSLVVILELNSVSGVQYKDIMIDR